MTTPAIADRPADATQAEGRPVVLFVDDEEGVLAGLRSTMRKLRRTYRFLFATGADEALTLMAGEPVDVVVTDMRMPGKTGADLLHVVRDRHPEVIRYVLSGEAEADLVVRSVPVTHRWLSKPCDRDVLTEALTEAVQHRGLIADGQIRRALAGASSLPSPPALYVELLALLSDEDASMDRVAELVATDAAVAAKLLQWANSVFSGGQPVRDVRAAVARIGFSAVSQLVLSTEVARALLPTESIPGCEPSVLNDHVTSVSTLAAALARPDQAMQAGLGGLFSYIGLLLEISHLADRIGEAYALAERSGIGLVDAERELFGVAHPELGGHLLSIWGLPSDVVLLASGAHGLPSADSSPPMAADEAVRAARLVAQRLPVASGLGAPYIDRLDDDLAAAVTGWASAAIGPDGEGAG